MEINKVEGEDRGKVILYALSTCGWCRKTKKLLDELGVEYTYIYMDHLEGEEKDGVRDEVMKWNPRCSFPTLVINDKDCVIGFKEDQIREALSG